MTIGTDHPDYVHTGEMPYVIDGTADTTPDEHEGCLFCPLVWIAFGAFVGAVLFFLGRWSA